MYKFQDSHLTLTNTTAMWHVHQSYGIYMCTLYLGSKLRCLIFSVFSPYSLQTTWTAFKWRWVVCWRSCTVLIKKFQGFSKEAWQRQKIISSLFVCNQSCLSFQPLVCMLFVVCKWPLKIYLFIYLSLVKCFLALSFRQLRSWRADRS